MLNIKVTIKKLSGNEGLLVSALRYQVRVQGHRIVPGPLDTLPAEPEQGFPEPWMNAEDALQTAKVLQVATQIATGELVFD